jgi:dolichol-phosphate mannosyltransferase
MRTLVVIPTYNEALNLEPLAARLLALELAPDVLVADDASPDGTGVLADRLATSSSGRVQAVHREGKGGRGGAVLAGLRHGVRNPEYTHFVEMDADLSHLPEELPRLLEAARGVDVVIGSRYQPGGKVLGWSWRRRIWSKMSNRLIHMVLRLPVRDYTNGYRVYSRQAVDVLLAADLRERGYISLSEWAVVLASSGFSFANVPITFENRRFGVSKMSASEALGALRGLFRLRNRRVRRLADRAQSV